MNRISRILSLTLLSTIAFSPMAVLAQDQHSAYQKAVSAPYPCDVNWTAPPLNQLTPDIVSANLDNGNKLYTVRVQLHTPEGNTNECSVRQYHFHFPNLQNWVGSTTGAVPTIQVTLESTSQGLGDAMLLYSIQRIDNENGFSAFMMDAQTPHGYQSPEVYYANVTVIGKPVAEKGR